MSITEQALANEKLKGQEAYHSWFRANWGLVLGAAVLLAILFLPTPAGLSVGG